MNTDNRIGSPSFGSERDMLRGFLDYGRHNGHADFLREGVDGTVGAWLPRAPLRGIGAAVASLLL